MLTNREKYFGAAEILLPSVCRKIGEKLESDYYILEWEDEDKKIVYYRKEYVGDKVTKIEVEYPDGKDCEGLINQLLRDFSLD